MFENKNLSGVFHAFWVGAAPAAGVGAPDEAATTLPGGAADVPAGLGTPGGAGTGSPGGLPLTVASNTSQREPGTWAAIAC